MIGQSINKLHVLSRLRRLFENLATLWLRQDSDQRLFGLLHDLVNFFPLCFIAHGISEQQTDFVQHREESTPSPMQAKLTLKWQSVLRGAEISSASLACSVGMQQESMMLEEAAIV